MKRTLSILAAGACVFAGLAASAQAADMALTRLDCGTPQAPVAVNERFSDTYAYGDLKLQFVFSCYVIKHDNDYLLWDTGHSMTAPNVAPKVSIVDQLAKIDIKPDQIKYVGISHYHADHTGQVASFPKATLLIGSKEWEAISAPTPAAGVNFKPFEGWIKGENKVEPQPLDKDVFGDGTVDRTADSWTHAGPSSLAREATAGRGLHPDRRRGPLPREPRFRRRARIQLRSCADCGVDGAHQEDRGESEGVDHHPARCARHRKIAGVSRVGEVAAASAATKLSPNSDRERCSEFGAALTLHPHGTYP